MLHNQCLVKSQTYIESIKDEVKYKKYYVEGITSSGIKG